MARYSCFAQPFLTTYFVLKQYRCHPGILAFSNEHFYDNRIRSHESVQRRGPVVDFPVKFIDTATYGEEEREGSSFRNDFEASSVLLLLKKDKDVRGILASTKNASIMVIAPYRAQVTLLRRKILEQNHLRNVRCDTVDAFQGQEADVVVMSLVRTRSAGFTDE